MIMDFLFLILGVITVIGVAVFSYFIGGVIICLIADVVIFFTKEKEEDK